MRAFVVVTLCLFAPVVLAQSEGPRAAGAAGTSLADAAVPDTEAQDTEAQDTEAQDTEAQDTEAQDPGAQDPKAQDPETQESEARAKERAAQEAKVFSGGVPVQTRVFAAAAAALGGGGGVLLALPLTVPIIYLAALVQVPAAAGALPLLLAVPLMAALGSGGAVALFSEGAGPWITGIATGAAAGLTTLLVGALVVPQRPSTLLDLHLGVLSVVVVPSLAAAASAAALAPFFVPASARADIE